MTVVRDCPAVCRRLPRSAVNTRVPKCAHFCVRHVLTWLKCQSSKETRARHRLTPRSLLTSLISATDITNFLEYDGTLKAAQRIAGHADSPTTKLYDRRDPEVLLEDMEASGAKKGSPRGKGFAVGSRHESPRLNRRKKYGSSRLFTARFVGDEESNRSARRDGSSAATECEQP
jgi:hypothetical protein